MNTRKSDRTGNHHVACDWLNCRGGGRDIPALSERKRSSQTDKMDYLITLLGAVAAVLTSLSYFPQVRKAYPRGSTKDLSLQMLIALTSGLALRIIYGILKADWVIVAANVVGASLTGTILGFKLRDMDQVIGVSQSIRIYAARFDSIKPGTALVLTGLVCGQTSRSIESGSISGCPGGERKQAPHWAHV
jgi:MtN3 and saliva related transmembrane protein